MCSFYHFYCVKIRLHHRAILDVICFANATENEKFAWETLCDIKRRVQELAKHYNVSLINFWLGISHLEKYHTSTTQLGSESHKAASMLFDDRFESSA